ncbi:MAG: type II toxin-antitoxin system antitoxin SocA domain-containing protein [Deltaproteobacteria bacterium]
MDIVDLIVIVTKTYKERIGIAPAKTKLLKLAYLAEVYFKRLTGKRLTDQQWVFWKYGPYLWEYETMISNEAIFLKPDEEGEFYPVEGREDYQSKGMSLEEQNSIGRALEHAADDLNQILDFVYFDTEPMMKAQTRGEQLDFDSVMPEEFYAVKHYKVDKKQGQQITQKVRKWENDKKSA